MPAEETWGDIRTFSISVYCVCVCVLSSVIRGEQEEAAALLDFILLLGSSNLQPARYATSKMNYAAVLVPFGSITQQKTHTLFLSQENKHI